MTKHTPNNTINISITDINFALLCEHSRGAINVLMTTKDESEDGKRKDDEEAAL